MRPSSSTRLSDGLWAGLEAQNERFGSNLGSKQPLAYSHQEKMSSGFNTWMGGRVVEGTGLENRQTCKRLVGSNPTPSAI